MKFICIMNLFILPGTKINFMTGFLRQGYQPPVGSFMRTEHPINQNRNNPSDQNTQPNQPIKTILTLMTCPGQCSTFVYCIQNDIMMMLICCCRCHKKLMHTNVTMLLFLNENCWYKHVLVR